MIEPMSLAQASARLISVMRRASHGLLHVMHTPNGPVWVFEGQVGHANVAGANDNFVQLVEQVAPTLEKLTGEDR